MSTNYFESYFDSLPALFPANVSGMDVFDNIDSIFSNVFKTPIIKKSFPYPIDIFDRIDPENKKIKETVIQIALAGFTKDEIEVKAIRGKQLTIKITPVEGVEDNIRWISNGIARRSAVISWSISDKIDLTEFKPKFQNGILTIVLPFMKETENKDEIIGVIEDC